MSPTETLVSSAGSKWKPPAPALTTWTRASAALVCVAADEVEDAMLGGELVDVTEDFALTWLSVVSCAGLCARTATSMSASIAARASGVDMVDACVLRFRFCSGA
jgi:hypothetical protein